MNGKNTYFTIAWVVFAGSFTTLDIGGSGAWAQSESAPPKEFDCVIEPRTIAKIGSSGEGVIEIINVDRGDIVKRGDVLAKLQSTLEEVEVDLAKERANNDINLTSGKARLKYEQQRSLRVQKLHKKGVVSTATIQEIETAMALAEAEVRSALLDVRLAKLTLKQAITALDRRTIRSPIDGIVTERTMAPGEFAYDQTPLMTIAEIDPLNVEVYIPISHYGSIKKGTTARVIPEKPIGGVYAAQVTVLDQVFDAASGTFGVRLALPNPDYKIPAGLKCRVRFNPQPKQ